MARRDTLADVEQATLAWVCWYNTRGSAGDRRQAEAEYYATDHRSGHPAGDLHT